MKESRLFLAVSMLICGAAFTTAEAQLVYGPNSSGQFVTDQNLNQWTVIFGVVYKNGSPTISSPNATLLLWIAGVIYVQDPTGRWFSWTGLAWASATDPRGH